MIPQRAHYYVYFPYHEMRNQDPGAFIQYKGVILQVW